ncbi:hypothetical protein BDY21DRAFT_290610 [Lineolata rhizophorae]|uniref:Ribosome biogenesis protein YTM1 n=1 Tax=Lineolata rhizophorae TaxID=578093 RepID=A0A6A6NU39_9PEZI|nr:hypothetical protein BDY21DRAFT_290610 [Lineolata rhizophorae]
MAHTPTDDELATAVLQFVDQGTFPESEAIASADVRGGTLPKVLEALSKAREDAKAMFPKQTELRTLSRTAAPTTTAWLTRARALESALATSRATASSIVASAHDSASLTAAVDDAQARVNLLESELVFNERVEASLEAVAGIAALLDEAQEDALRDELVRALENVEEAVETMERVLEGVGEEGRGMTAVAAALRERGAQLRGAIAENAVECWNALVVVDPGQRKVTVKDEIQSESTVNINPIIEALSRLNLLDTSMARFARDFESTILLPRLAFASTSPEPARTLSPTAASYSDTSISAISIRNDDIALSGPQYDLSTAACLHDLHRVAAYLSTRLPPSISAPLFENLLPTIQAHLVPTWLDATVPLSLDAIDDFQEVLDLLTGLAEYVAELGWAGKEDLLDWVEKAPKNWLARRREDAVDAVRGLCAVAVREKVVVERVEREVVRNEEVVAAATQEEEDWGAEWGDEGEGGEDLSGQAATGQGEDEDLSAWGADDDADDDSKSDERPAMAKPEQDGDDYAEDDAEEAWGWGDEDGEANKPAAPKSQAPGNGALKTNGTGAKGVQQEPREREVELRENYTITAVPDGILEIIAQVIADAEELAQPRFADTAIAPAAAGLYSIPTLVLAMFRATASPYYTPQSGANMLLYNDCTRIAEQLSTFLAEQAARDADPANPTTAHIPAAVRPSARLRLGPDLKALEAFGRRAYGREMEAQRTVVRDLLDGAQGFANSTAQPFKSECENAVQMAADRIRDVGREWEGVLSRSALLQSLGSLVGTAVGKFVNEVLDLGDISEEESKRLRELGEALAGLSDLLCVRQEEDGQEADMSGVYAPGWFRFQYLMEILESSLADIKYLWSEGELALEFAPDEVVDLIEALFAESEHRRRAIAEIRRSSLRRYPLSTLVNTLLETPRPIPFDFLIDGRPLRSTLDDYLTQHGISAETTLTLEYIRALVPPTQVTTFQHDDWVSSVDVLSASSAAGATADVRKGWERILSGSYDGLLRVWSSAGTVVATSPTVADSTLVVPAVKAARWVSATQIVSSGMDRTVRVWHYDEPSPGDLEGPPASLTPTLELYGHTASVDTVAAHADSARFLTASADGAVGYWTSDKSAAPRAPDALLPSSHKRRKLSASSKPASQRGPLAMLKAHTAPSSAAFFAPADHTVAYSAGWDHALRTWDLPTATHVDARALGSALTCGCGLAPSLGLLAAGMSTGVVACVDPRAAAGGEGGSRVAVLTLRGGKAAVPVGAVVGGERAGSEWGVVAGSWDGKCRVWDVRYVRPAAGAEEVGQGWVGMVGDSVWLFGREGPKAEEDRKVFDVAWDREIGIVSAGEDRRVQVNRAPETVGER